MTGVAGGANVWPAVPCRRGSRAAPPAVPAEEQVQQRAEGALTNTITTAQASLAAPPIDLARARSTRQ